MDFWRIPRLSAPFRFYCPWHKSRSCVHSAGALHISEELMTRLMHRCECCRPWLRCSQMHRGERVRLSCEESGAWRNSKWRTCGGFYSSTFLTKVHVARSMSLTVKLASTGSDTLAANVLRILQTRLLLWGTAAATRQAAPRRLHRLPLKSTRRRLKLQQKLR